MKYKRTIQNVVALALAFAWSGAAFASAQTAKEEEELDAKLGIDNKPFLVNLAMLKTRTQLREAANVRTGLPPYDQQVENAQGAPESLLADLMKPLQETIIPVVQSRTDDSSSVKDEPTQVVTPIENPTPTENLKPNCYVDQNGQLICE